MADETGPAKRAFQIEISGDRMSAFLRARRGIGELQPADVLSALEQQQIVITDPVAEAVDDLCHRESPLKPGECAALAQGTPPVAALGPRVEPVAIQLKEGSTQRDRSNVPSVDEGMRIGILLPPKPGTDGCDVLGQPVPHKKASDALPLGQFVRLGDDGVSILAERAGLVQIKQGRISVETFLEVPENLDYSVGNIDFQGCVLIRGSVADLFKLRAKEDVYIGGAVEAADIDAGHDLKVNGGICCRDKGHIIAGHDVEARFVNNAVVQCGHDMVVQSEIANSRVFCKGKLTVLAGAIYSSHVAAAGGLAASSIGSPAFAKTLVECGIDEALRRKAAAELPQIQASQSRAKRVRETVVPLLENQKSLTAGQKEKATEMLYDAEQMRQAADRALADIAQDYDDYTLASKGAEIFVAGTIWPGTTIRFPELETTLRMPLRGPVRIACRSTQGQRMILAIYQNTHLTQQLEIRSIADPTMDELVKTLNEGKQLHETVAATPIPATAA